jgi:uncharacterized membrane protein
MSSFIKRRNMKTKDYTNKFTSEEIKKGKLLSIISYFGVLSLIPFLTSNNKYVLYHSKQGIRLTLIYTVLLLILIPLNKINYLWKIIDILIPIIIIISLAISIIGIYDVIRGKAKELPILNKIFKFKIKESK